ncbi:restriction endonuclease subunit S [Pseudobutyrivibrio xylanivorans]|uniref:Restriction endonuclease subunit S n=1 Tax=Pseudobutyrivibrio xylanivorans TaxID=185007 RepID=A0A5P6VW93_PSEXY|nr:restriction endonuclease subunit S [Pseudobutyrivibrio xylanivorans]
MSGYSYKGAELQDSSIAMATIKNFDRKGGFKLDGYKEIVPSSKLKPEHHATLFDTLVAHTDLTQNAEVIGNAEPVLSLSGYQDIIFSMDVVKVLPKHPQVSQFLIAALLQTQQFKSHCLGYVNGTTVLHLSKKALPEYSLMMPKDFSILKPLDDAVSVLYQKMASIIEENVQLAKLRDSLLPKFMSGEINVSDLDI